MRLWLQRSRVLRSLLYISPIVPSLHGNGLAMRAANVLLALATRYRVSLLVFPRYGSPSGMAIPPEIRNACANAGLGSLGNSDSAPAGRFDVVHVFRLAAIPFAEPWLRLAGIERWLDLDDVESLTHRRISELYQQEGDDVHAAEELEAARQAEEQEIAALRRFDRVFVASHLDVERLPLCDAARVEALPNILPPADPLPLAPAGDPFTLLFVGTLDYYPNIDALKWFGTEVLPIVRANASRDVELDVVGTGWSKHFPRLSQLHGIRMIGPAPDLRAEYARSHAVVVPLRAGGGTRIKIIEAFGLRRPVVGTTLGFEGIDARDGEHALIADTAETFADACLRLIELPELGDRLAGNAFALARDRYSTAALNHLIASRP